MRTLISFSNSNLKISKIYAQMFSCTFKVQILTKCKLPIYTMNLFTLFYNTYVDIEMYK